MVLTRKGNGSSSQNESDSHNMEEGGKDKDPASSEPASSRRLVIKSNIDGDSLAARPATPVRRSRRLSGDPADSLAARPATPVRRSRRLSGDPTDSLAVRPATPVRRSRRLSGDHDLTQTPSKRSGQISTENEETLAPEPQTSIKHTRRVSLGSQDALEVQTQIRRSRRLSTSGSGHDLHTDCQDSPIVPTPARRSRRHSSTGISESECSSKIFPEGKEPKESLQIIEESDELIDNVGNSLILKSEDTATVTAECENVSKCQKVEETLTVKSKLDTLSVIEEVEELGIENNSKPSNSHLTNEDSVLDSKNESFPAVHGKETKTSSLLLLEVTSDEEKCCMTPMGLALPNECNEEELEIDVVGLDQEIVKGDCPALVIGNGESISVIGDETVSTTVMTDEEVLSGTNKLTPTNSKEILCKDREVSSTTNINDALDDCENYQPTEHKTKKIKINNNTEILDENLELANKIAELKKTPRGLPVSGRWWKKEKERFRSINKDATGKKSWEKKMKIKQNRQNVMAKSAAIQAEKQRKKDELRERRRLNKIRREENAKKAEIVQVIKNPLKIKKMKRKQLRYIETRDTSEIVKN
ncbi:polyamine-modulated factor 1-binding protein 1 [Cherax quadricarinatus]